jgi:hypothetical protein
LALLAVGMCVATLIGCASSASTPVAANSTTPIFRLAGTWRGADRVASKYCDVGAVAGVNGGEPKIGPCTVQVDWTSSDEMTIATDGHVSLGYRYDSGPGVPRGSTTTVDAAHVKQGNCDATATVGAVRLTLAGTECHGASGDRSPINIDALTSAVTWKLDDGCLTVTSVAQVDASTRFERADGDCKGPDPTYPRFTDPTGPIEAAS